LPVDLLRIPLFALSIGTSVCSFLAQMLAYVALPFYLQDGLGRGAVATGLLMTPWPLATAVAAPIAGRLADRYPAGILGAVGPAGSGAGRGSRGRLPGALRGQHRVADGARRLRLRHLPVAEQPGDPRLRPAAPERRGERHARHRAAARPDHRHRLGGAGVRAL